MSVTEQSLANRDTDGFLRLAHVRWQEAKQDNAAQKSDAVDAVKSVQRTQREAAKAASGSPTAPRKQPTGSTTPDASKDLTQDEVSDLMRQANVQYK